MHEDFRYHAREKESEEAPGKLKVDPVMSILHDFQCITLEGDFAVKIHLMESLHWDLVLPSVLQPVLFVLEFKVVLDGPARVSSFLVFAR